MDSEQQPFPGRSFRSLLQTLPAELLHHIFGYLPLQDVLAARKTSRLMASVGLDHYDDEVALVYHRDKFGRLCEIAEHPRIAKQIRSLFFKFDRCIWMPYDHWVLIRSDPSAEATRSAEEEACSNQDTESRNRAHVVYMEAASARKAAVPESDRREAYRVFEALCQDAIEVQKSGYDSECLKSLFKQCPKLREVKIASNGFQFRRMNAELTTFSDAMIVPHESQNDAGKYQVLMVATAINETGSTLDSLTLHVSDRIFDMRSSVLKALVRPLSRLRMFIEEKVDYDSDEYPDVDVDVKRGNLIDLLAEARNLRVLRLGLPWQGINARDGFAAAFEKTREDLTYKHLYELVISDSEIGAELLLALVLRHKATLRRLSLSWLTLPTENAHPTTWRNVFTMLSGQLPKLQIVRLRGKFGLVNATMDWFPQIDVNSDSHYQHALENFVLNGGEWPEKSSAVVLPEVSDKLRFLSNDCMEPDDPARHYKPDEFDRLDD